MAGRRRARCRPRRRGRRRQTASPCSHRNDAGSAGVTRRAASRASGACLASPETISMMRRARRMSPRPSVSPWRTGCSGLEATIGWLRDQLGERCDVAERIEALRRLVERQVPVQSEPQDAEVDGSRRLQGRSQPAGTPRPHPARRRGCRSSAPAAPRGGRASCAPDRRHSSPDLRGRGPAHSSSWMNRALPSRSGAAGQQLICAGRRSPTREADQEAGLRASRLPDDLPRLLDPAPPGPAGR